MITRCISKSWQGDAFVYLDWDCSKISIYCVAQKISILTYLRVRSGCVFPGALYLDIFEQSQENGVFQHGQIKQPQAKVRERSSPKLYWFDAGVARDAAGLLDDALDSFWLGFSLETWVYHELRVYNHTQNKNRLIAYYNTANNSEIDFVIETQKRTLQKKAHVICLEVKFSKKWDRQWEKPIRSLKATGKLVVEKMIGLYRGEQKWIFDDFEVWPVTEFLKALHAGTIF